MRRVLLLCYGEWEGLALLGFVGAPWGLVCMGDAGSAGAFPHIHRAWVTEVCLSLFGRRSAGALSSRLSVSFLDHTENVFVIQWRWRDSGKIMLYMLALVRQPSLRGRDACMVFRARGHSGEIAGKIYIRPLFLLFLFFC